ncbi:toll/interleukin-1 receptor domain-containing protein [Algoriphagus machipongonensis]|uniref:TIR domain-containing protein n=1 Tax=Algoriphagus machipongonensis TaxID=388413 RepID=A3I1A7_9BACT|nr:toll/interleukin-1 receptor domain-containing protein [Algoriphagus machipongonensis]EAZ79573.1 hypothetical protein ALPR1_08113 [Algoriphagus machipongonensis]
MADNKIFVSYRRQDASGEAGRLVDHLQEVFGDDTVFLDVETIEAGLDFVQAIDKALNSCKVLIALIGPHWLNIKDSEGNPRLFHEGDFIRLEISAALKRDIRVIPVLVNGAVMPKSEELPEELQALTRRHAHELSSSRWKYDCDQLIEVLSKIIKPLPKNKPFNPIPPIQKKEKSWFAKNYIWLLAAIVGLIIFSLMLENSGDEYPNDYSEETQVALEDFSNDPGTASTEDFQELQEESTMEPEIQNTPSQNNSQPTSPEIDEISGFWLQSDGQGNTSTLVFNQYEDGYFEFIEYNFLDAEIGEGSGTITDNKLTADYYNTFFQIGGKLNLSTNNYGRTWSGTIDIDNPRTQTKIMLQRINP